MRVNEANTRDQSEVEFVSLLSFPGMFLIDSFKKLGIPSISQFLCNQPRDWSVHAKRFCITWC